MDEEWEEESRGGGAFLWNLLHPRPQPEAGGGLDPEAQPQPTDPLPDLGEEAIGPLGRRLGRQRAGAGQGGRGLGWRYSDGAATGWPPWRHGGETCWRRRWGGAVGRRANVLARRSQSRGGRRSEAEAGARGSAWDGGSGERESWLAQGGSLRQD
ncbi:hypothetical protein PAHAL_6G141500 [Panicum hallii]|uniref:Uncharacterized protein n=1 Tax=Panicum hallii TaxID=206008 RepID=A0A2T8IG87_9POAL|nr:hypothetical protein PAHAL_6G141500 [Panicum hallii]